MLCSAQEEVATILGQYWYWGFYVKHPNATTGPQSETHIGDKPKLYCKACLAQHVVDLQQNYDMAIVQGLAPAISRDEGVIKSYCMFIF